MDTARRSRVICAATLVVGAGILAWTLSIRPGDRLFYPATVALAVTWIAGYVLAGRASRHDGESEDAGGRARALALGVMTGCALICLFLVGALVLSRIPVLREPVETLLDHTQHGAFVGVLVLALVNGWAEELFFRGALFDALREYGVGASVVATTLVYTVVTAASGVWMLALAGLLLGAVCAVLRARTGGTTASIATHLTWSLGMIFLLPPVLDTWS